MEAGNGGDWASSAGTSGSDSEWHVLDQNDWTYLGSHPHDIEGGSDDGGASDSEICDDGIDNDGDSFIDCDDWDCDGTNGNADPACEGSVIDISDDAIDYD